MSHITLEERVAALERRVTELAAIANGSSKNWQSTVGMFSGDEVMKRIDENGRKWREAERKKARARGSKKKRPTTS